MNDTYKPHGTVPRYWLPVGALGPPVVLWLVVVASTSMQMNSALLALAIVVVPVSVVIVQSLWAPTRSWSLDRGVHLGDAYTRLLHRQLARTRVARTVGVTGGISANIMLMSSYNADPDASRWFLDDWNELQGYWMPALGYVLGSIWAEAFKCGFGDPSAGTAVLSTRQLRDYLDSTIEFLFGMYVMAAVVSVVVGGFLLRDSKEGISESGSLRILIGLAVTVLAVGGAMWTCRRRELAADAEALAYEELTRTATANGLIGAAIAVVAEFSGSVMSSAGVSPPGWIQLIFVLAGILAVGIWVGSGTALVFRSRRIDKLRAAA